MINMLGFCSDSQTIWRLIGTVINIVKIAIPVIIIIFAMLDLGKAVMAGKEDEIKNAQKLLIKRLIYGVVIFFVITIVQTIFNLIGHSVSGGDDEDAQICWKCVTRPEECQQTPTGA